MDAMLPCLPWLRPASPRPIGPYKVDVNSTGPATPKHHQTRQNVRPRVGGSLESSGRRLFMGVKLGGFEPPSLMHRKCEEGVLRDI